MRMKMTRREALKGMGLAGLGLLAKRGMALTVPKDGPHGKWWRGNLHMHTYWSDGITFPEQAVDLYKNTLGYDFLAMSEHNVFADNADSWKPVAEKQTKWPPEVIKTIFDRYMQSAAGKEAQTRTAADGTTEVRLKTYDEVKRMFDEPGRFLLMPGVEITQHCGVEVHLNYINLPDVVPSVKGGPANKGMKAHPTDIIAQNVKEVAALAAQLKRPSMLMLNHPEWRYFDILPEHLINNPEVLFFEVANCGSDWAPPDDLPVKSNDLFWDVINAFRMMKGHPLIYGTGTDDTHSYPGEAEANYTVVRSAELSPDALLAAMHAGDFYASTGVILADIAFDAAKRSLHVKVLPAPDASYTISFITTKKNFDQTVRTVEVPAVEKGRPRRTLPIYSADIGKTAHRAEGTEATYTMAPDDLYVRARIESSQPNPPRGRLPHIYPDKQVAWTQPYA